MNAEGVLKVLAERMRGLLSEGNPLRGGLFVTVAEEKEEDVLRTYGVLQAAKGGAQEIVAGNNTWRISCRLYAVFFPPQGDGETPEEIYDWMSEAAYAVMAAGRALVGVCEYGDFVVLGVAPVGPVRWGASERGFEGEFNFTLAVQF